MVSEEAKQLLTPILLETPILIVIALRDILMLYLLRVTNYNLQMARILYIVIFIMAGVLTGFLFLMVQINAQREVSGKRFLVGIKYNRNGIGKRIQKELGIYSFISKINHDGVEYHVYAVWKKAKGAWPRKIIDYILLIDKTIEEALNAASTWNVYVAGWWAPAQVYPVTLFELEGKAIDVIREAAKLDQRVPIYVIRDYPGRIVKERGDLIGTPETG
jgi:hypothetical protein